MTSRTEAIAHWRALDREGDDKCRLARTGEGWMLIGHARFRDGAGFAALDYVVRCDGNWHTLGADLAGLHGGRNVSLQITCDAEGWKVNGVAQAGLDTACDIDLSFTPATNLMPLRRLEAQGGVGIAVCSAWIDYPETALKPLDQIYSRNRAEGLISYRAEQTGYETQLTIDPCGFVTHYPGLWEGEVTRASA